MNICDANDDDVVAQLLSEFTRFFSDAVPSFADQVVITAMSLCQYCCPLLPMSPHIIIITRIESRCSLYSPQRQYDNTH